MNGFRKLTTTVAAIAAIVGIVITLALNQPGLLDVTAVTMSLILIAGLGGFNIYTQGRIDQQPTLPTIPDLEKRA